MDELNVMNPILFKQSTPGFTVIEVLLALGAVSFSFFVLATGLNLIQSQTVRSEIYSRALTLENHILSSLGEPKTYNQIFDLEADITHRDRLNAGLQPTGLNIDFQGNVIATVGSQRLIDLSFAECSAGSAGCHFRIDFDIQCREQDNRLCFAAYRIAIENLPPRMISMQPFGARSPGPGFASADYSYPIHFERILRQQVVSCPQESPIMMGFEPETGEPFCAALPPDDCEEGRLFAGYSVVNGEIEAVCNPTRGVTCPNPFAPLPNPYGLEKVTSGRKGGVLGFYDGVCIFMTPPQAPWAPEALEPQFLPGSALPQSVSVSFKACPGPYYVAGPPPTGCSVTPVVEFKPGPIYPDIDDLAASLVVIPKQGSIAEEYRCDVFIPAQTQAAWQVADSFRVELVAPPSPQCIWDPSMNIQQRIPAVEEVHGEN